MIENAAVYVDEGVITHNTEILREKYLRPNTKIIAVIKANGYGAGLIESGHLCEKLGIDALAVLDIPQGITLRKAGIQLPIILLGSSPVENHGYLVEYDLTQGIFSYEHAQSLNTYALEHDVQIKGHVKFDSGLNRLGLKNYEEIDTVMTMPGLKITGIYTHFASAQSYDEEELDFSNQQVKRFKNLLHHLDEKGYDYGMTHMQNSPSILNFGDLGFDAVRCGMVLYGLFHPSQLRLATEAGFKPSLSMKVKIAHVKTIEKGESVGYGRTFTADKTMKIATLAGGYCDGIMRNLSKNGGFVVYQDQNCPILGDIAMSQFMVDVSDLKQVNVGDEVFIFGHPNLSIYDYIDYTGQTINELVSHLRLDMKRIYVNTK